MLSCEWTINVFGQPEASYYCGKISSITIVSIALCAPTHHPVNNALFLISGVATNSVWTRAGSIGSDYCMRFCKNCALAFLRPASDAELVVVSTVLRLLSTSEAQMSLRLQIFIASELQCSTLPAA